MFVFFTYWLEPLACLLYVTAFFIHYRSHRKKLTASLGVYYLVAGILLTVAIFTTLLKWGNTIWLYDIVACLTTVCIGFYFYHILQTTQKKFTVLTLIALFVGYALFHNLTLEGTRLFDSIGYSILSASVTVYVFMYFHQLLKNVSAKHILQEFNFWLAAGYLVYFLGSFIIFLTYFYFTKKLLENYTVKGRDLLMALWGLHNVLFFMGAFSLLIGSLWIVYRRKSVSSS